MRLRPSSLGTLTAALLLCAAAAGQALDEPAPPKPSIELLESLGVRANPEPGVKGLLDQFSKAHPQVPHDFWRALYEYHSNPEPLRNGLAALVERDLTADEIEAALTFFRSDVGKKVIEVRVTLATESKGVARKLANEFRDDVRARLKKAGYLE